MKTPIASLVIATLVSVPALAGPLTFDFKDPKGVNNVVFKLDAPLEAIHGNASGVSGTVTFDPQAPGATHGRIEVTADSLMVPNAMMKEHMHGPQWLDVAKHPKIVFEAKELKNAKTAGNVTTGEAVGTFTLHGVTKPLTVPVRLTHLVDKLGQRVPNQKGDLLVLRADFRIQRSDFGINPAAPQDKVSDTIDLSLSLAGASPR